MTTTRSTTPNSVTTDSGLLQQFTPTSATTWWALVGDNLKFESFIVRTVDSGTHWDQIKLPVRDVTSSQFLNADAAWVEGDALGEPNSQPVFRTLDGGHRWQRLGNVPDCQLQFVDTLHGWCVSIGAAAGSEAVDIDRTTDGGATWKLISSTDVPGAHPGTAGAIPFGCDKSVVFSSAKVGWAPFYCNGGTGTAATVDQSNDGGSTWHALPPVRFPPGLHTDSGAGVFSPVLVAGSDVTMVANFSGRPTYTAICTSTDNGQTWHTHVVPDPTKAWEVDLIDPTHWRLNDGKTLTATDDAGQHWRTTTLHVNMKDATGTPLTLHFLSLDLGWAVPSANGGPLWWTTDNGVHWKPITITAGPYRLPTP